jgi:hypothetical protein
MILDTTNLDSILAFISFIVAAVIAWWQNRGKTVAVAQVAALTPGTPESQAGAVVATLPARSWKMSPATLQWITFDATPENKATIIAQVQAAEANHLTDYRIDFAGGYYLIQYGLQYGGAGNPSGK